METYMGGGGSVGGGICNIVSHEGPPAVVSASGPGLCNFNAKTRCYELQQQQGHPSVPVSSSSVENPSIISTTAVPPSSGAGLGPGGQYDWAQQQQIQQMSCTSGGLRDAYGGHQMYLVQQQQLQPLLQPETNEFVGVSGLDILKGVGQDSIIGIRSQALEISDPSGLGPKKMVTVLDPASGAQLAISSPPSSLCATAVPTVGILVVTNDQVQQPQPPPAPVITITETGEPIEGMLDRISHDLDYLLNRTAEVPTVVPIQLRPPGGGPSSSSSNCNGAGPSTTNDGSGVGMCPSSSSQKSPLLSSCHSSSIHEVIIEESEEVDS